MHPTLKLMVAGLSHTLSHWQTWFGFSELICCAKFCLLCFVGYDSECDLCDASACFSIKGNAAAAFILNQTLNVKFVSDKTYFIQLSFLPNIFVNAHAHFPPLS